ncbi:hypothetical protein, partial [Mitsuokella jalaludinii]|uniref:hypothetical protein n=1 Tax=Mitsuokella jalaludinii TaxID=187979 RepID=UPI003076EEB3
CKHWLGAMSKRLKSCKLLVSLFLQGKARFLPSLWPGGGMTVFFDLAKIKWIETFDKARKAYTGECNHSSAQQERWRNRYGRTI